MYRYTRLTRNENVNGTKMRNCCVISLGICTGMTHPLKKTNKKKTWKKGSAVSSLIRLTDFVKWDAALRDLFAQKALHAKDNVCNISITLSVQSGAYSKCWSAHSLSVCLFLSVSPLYDSHNCWRSDCVPVCPQLLLSCSPVFNASRPTSSSSFSVRIPATTAHERWNHSHVWGQQQKWEVLVIITNNKWLFTAIEIKQLALLPKKSYK